MKNKELAKRLKELRKRKGFSQEELSLESGLSLRTIQRVENGETEPLGDSLKRLALALDVTPDELIDWTMKEDRGYLKALNLSALTFLFFPLLGILVPFIMWISKKDKIKDLNNLGMDLINFEITWTLLLFVGLLLNPLIQFISTKEVSFATIIVPGLIFFAIMYTLNFFFIIVNTIRITNDTNVKYFPKISFLRK